MMGRQQNKKNVVMFGCVKIGGVRRDIPDDVLRGIVARLYELLPQIKDITNVFLEDYSAHHRMEGVGVISRKDAYYMGMVGPMIRACGIPSDTRKIGYAAYKHVQFEPVIAEAGDCYARCVVRVNEIPFSMDLIRQFVEKIPEGPTEVKVKGTPDGEFFGRIEQPRGGVGSKTTSNGVSSVGCARGIVPQRHLWSLKKADHGRSTAYGAATAGGAWRCARCMSDYAQYLLSPGKNKE